MVTGFLKVSFMSLKPFGTHSAVLSSCLVVGDRSAPSRVGPCIRWPVHNPGSRSSAGLVGQRVPHALGQSQCCNRFTWFVALVFSQRSRQKMEWIPAGCAASQHWLLSGLAHSLNSMGLLFTDTTIRLPLSLSHSILNTTSKLCGRKRRVQKVGSSGGGAHLTLAALSSSLIRCLPEGGRD